MTVVLPQQQRNAGTYRSPSGPSTLVAGKTITASGLLGQVDLEDATLQITLAVEANNNAGAAANDPGWYTLTGADWVGGHQDRHGLFPPPTLVYSSTSVSAAIVRGLMVLNKRVSFGIDVVVT